MPNLQVETYAPGAGDTEGIDPRILRRRVEVDRGESRRRLAFLLATLAVVGAAGAGWGLTRSPLLDVDRVVVEGARTVPGPEVVAASGIRKGQPMADVDQGGAARAVARLPRIDRVSVRRHWPAIVEISVAERVPVAGLRSPSGRWALVDRSGLVLAEAAVLPAVPVLEGVPAAGPPGTRLETGTAQLVRLAAALPPPGALRAAALSVAPGGRLEMRLRPQGLVRFGDPLRLEEKVRAAEAVLSRIDVRQISVLDVQIPEAPSLTRR